MSNILIDGNRYDFLDYESEDEFEKDVVANSKVLFGQETVYLDIKRRIGEKASYNKGIPDGYLIDFSDIKHPQLYFVENELASHDLYGHISNQISRFIASIKTSPKQIRIKLLEEIKTKRVLRLLLIILLIAITLGISFKLSTGVSPFVYFDF